MIRHLLEEVRSAPLDADARERLVTIHRASVHELESALSPELAEELRRLSLPLADDDGEAPTDAELRIAQAQLVGWLEGLFHGIQTAIAAQQLQAAQAAALAHQLPPGAAAAAGQAPDGAPDGRPHPGQYL
ncbi:proteasome activator [Serinibacter arcticus]